VAQYSVHIKRTAAKELADLDSVTGFRIAESIDRLASSPRPRGCRKLAHSLNSYRIRTGDYRVLYQVDDRLKLVTIFAIGHRREVYR
jgi:mRNA interferase RelE/StbE